MESFAPHIYTFILPLFLGNVTHMFVVKYDYFKRLANPISIRLFGTGKTYRAFAVMPLICGVGSLVFRSLLLHNTGYWWSFGIGFILGFTYLLAELPNSYIKRRVGILPGQSHPRFKMIQYVIDKMDSLVPLCIVYYFITGISVAMASLLFTVSFFIHITFSRLLFMLKVKKSF